MSGHDQFGDRLVTSGQCGVEIASENALERLPIFPLWVFVGQHLDPIDDKRELEIVRLLRPKRAVIVECGNPLGDGHEVRATFLGHPIDKSDDRLLCGALVPGGKRLFRSR